MTNTSNSKQNGRTPINTPDPEVVPRAARRRFRAAYKRQIVAEAEACTKPGEIGDLLRREGLYSLPGFGAPGSTNYAAIGISGVRRMSPTVITRSVMPRAMAGVRSRYLLLKPGIGSRNDSCGRAKW